MKARFRRLLSELREAFWLVPALMVVAAIGAAIVLVDLDRRGSVPAWLIESAWLYSGGGTGARTLLGAVASSTIGVAGTAFSITIAALSLAAGQMGPRLLRNFTRDRGNQVTLGAFLATFSYALMVLRTVRTEGEGQFTPHLSLSIAILLAFVCVAMLIFFVGHMAGRINVDTVVELVSEDMRAAIDRLTTQVPQPARDDWRMGADAVLVTDPRRGYLQELDQEGLADWAAEHEATVKLLVRPGAYVFPGAPIALVSPQVDGADSAIRSATALGTSRASSADLEYAIRQLVEVAVRALSPGINDPHTAMSVLDRLGAALCEIARAELSNGVLLRDGRVALVVPLLDYELLVGAMFNLIRQNAAGSTAIYIRMLDVLTAVSSCEERESRLRVIERHADLVAGDAARTIQTPEDLDAVRARRSKLASAERQRPSHEEPSVHLSPAVKAV